jgi:hypothetical protein
MIDIIGNYPLHNLVVKCQYFDDLILIKQVYLARQFIKSQIKKPSNTL